MLRLFTGFNFSANSADLTDLMFVNTLTAESGTLVSAQGRGGGFALGSDDVDNQGAIFGPPVLDLANGNTFIMGGVFRVSSASATGDNGHLLGLGNISGTTITAQCSLFLNFSTPSDVKLEVYRNNTLLHSQSLGITLTSPTEWHVIEVRWVVDPTAGACRVLFDGVEKINLTGLNTRGGPNNECHLATPFGKPAGGSSLAYASSAPNAIMYCDCFWIMDETGSVTLTKDFLSLHGTPRVMTMTPTGNGANSQWLGSDGNSTDNYLLVDEASPNDNTDYVKSGNAGDKDSYTFTDFNFSVDRVAAVGVLANAIKDDATSRPLKGLVRPVATNYVSAGQETRQTTYRYHQFIFEQNPETNAEWSAAQVNASEFGVQVG